MIGTDNCSGSVSFRHPSLDDAPDIYRLRAITQMRMICVFNPALTGAETHDADGVYPLLKE